jgi:hypothetical protein
MNLRLVLFAAAALAAASWLCFALCRWDAQGNRDLAAIAREVQRGDELEAHREAVQRRNGAKRALAADVVAGRMPLREAAGHFRRLDEADPAYPAGIPRPPADDLFYRGRVLDFAWMVLGQQQRYAAAARFYAEAFTADSHLLTGRPSGHRYNAACAAALAGCGRGRDAADLDEASRAGFRRQALDWLRAELEARQRLLEQEPEKARWVVADDLQRWLGDSDFDGVRGPDALGQLPGAERQAWQELWADVADTLAWAMGRTPDRRLASRHGPVAAEGGESHAAGTGLAEDRLDECPGDARVPPAVHRAAPLPNHGRLRLSLPPNGGPPPSSTNRSP